MAILDMVAGLVAGPASRIVEAPVREIVDEVLRQQRVASPQEVARLRSEISSLTSELSKMAGKMSDIQSTLDTLSAAGKPAAKAKKETVAKETVAKKAAPKKAAPKKAEPKKAKAKAKAATSEKKRGRPSKADAGCNVKGCNGTHRSKGLCSKHYQVWRRGAQEGLVGPEGLASNGKVTMQVIKKLGGQPFKITGSGAKAKITVGGKSVDFKIIA